VAQGLNDGHDGGLARQALGQPGGRLGQAVLLDAQKDVARTAPGQYALTCAAYGQTAHQSRIAIEIQRLAWRDVDVPVIGCHQE
jgi:hypothetical protein